MDIQDTYPYLIHLGAILYLVCFLFRNQILLRSFAIAGDFAYTAYYFVAAEKPLWDAIFWNIPNIVINVVMITLILRDSKSTGFSDNELLLFRKLGSMKPGEFRKLIKLAKWHKADVETTLSKEGAAQDTLHYILNGLVDIEKSGRKVDASDGVFIGEIAFLKNQPATATVKVAAGAHYVTWQRADLEKVQAKDDGLKNALQAMLNADLANKVARS
jgi:Popeye protein conserved region